MTKAGVEENKGDISAVEDNNVESYNELVRQVQLGDIRLLNLKFDVKPDYYMAAINEKEGGKRLNRAFEGELVEVHYESESSTLAGKFEWLITATASRKKVLSISATYMVIYIDVPDTGEDSHTLFLERVGRIATYPYLRALVSQISWSSKSDLPIMPVLK